MKSAELITAIVMFVIAGILVLLSIRSFSQRGFVMNNAYIYASEEERKTMNKKPYYRQTAIVFCLLSAVFLIIGLSVVLRNDKLLWLQIPVFAGIVVYVAVSTVRIRKSEKK